MLAPNHPKPSIDDLAVGVQLWDSAGLLLYCNPATESQFGVVSGAVVDYEVFAAACCDEEGLPLAVAAFPVARVLAGGCASDERLVQLTTTPVCWLCIRAQWAEDGEGQHGERVLSTSIDITKSMERARALQRLAHYDALTDLPNRLLLADRMAQALAQAQRSGDRLAVCLLDLDGFKPVNDRFGHKVGDRLLQEIAARLHDAIRADDTVARLGGDEFVLLLGGLKSVRQAEDTLQRLLDTIAMPWFCGNTSMQITGSIGVTLFPNDNGDADQLLRHADQAMYKAKESGKGRYYTFNPAAESRIRANQGLLKRIEEALNKEQFILHYQPKVDCRSGQVAGLEALVRWQHPILGLRSPGEFIPLIEHENLIVQLGEWVLQETLRQLAEWHTQGIHLPVSVNIAARQFLSGSFNANLADMLAHHQPGLERRLELELVETAALEDVGAVRRVMESYQKRGVRFALDDFGTGYSSLIHLKRLAVDVLKVDQTFVRDMLDDPGDLAIVQGVIGLATAFGQKVVAEGVESIEQILLLLDLGCDVMQGYGIARPMPADRVATWLENFQPDPRWQLARGSYPMRGDFELLLMEVSHRHWIESFRNALQHARPLPPADYASCRFTQWYNEVGMRRYGNLASFREIDRIHRHLHQQAVTLTLATCMEAHDASDSATAGKALEQCNAELLQQLRAFRLGLADDSNQ